jgi:Ser/Thr protein kinase RdoA (MazF antagonist)
MTPAPRLRADIRGPAFAQLALMDTAIDIDWCNSRLLEHFRQPADVLEVRQVPSRLATVHQLVVKVGAARHCYYLKRHTASSLATGFAEYAAHMSAIARTLTNRAGLLPYDVIAVDSREGVVRVGETPGQTLYALHHEWIRTRQGRHAAIAAWRGVGRWLAVLHAGERVPVRSETRAAELVEYANERLVRWGQADPRQRPLADRAAHALRLAAARLPHGPVTITLCHGDVSAGNILVDGTAVGLIDLDDVRLDMPAVDLSQALWEIREYCRAATIVAMPRFERMAAAAFREGYGSSFPTGPDFWLPHIGNMAVILLTVAARRTGLGLGRVSEELRYTRALDELRRTIATIEHS